MPRRTKSLAPNNLTLRASADETEAYKALASGLEASPIPTSEILANIPLFLTRSSMSHLLFLDELYRKVLATPGHIFEFGVRWGRNLAVFHTLRTIYEPFNASRHIVGFDTFAGFPNTSSKDGTHAIIHRGALNVEKNYEQTLEQLLDAHQQLSPRGHLKRYELVKGDVIQTVPKYFRKHPEALIAIAYFDLDLYRPTREALKALRPRLTKGSVLVFDEVGLPEFPGETMAIIDELGAASYALRRDPRCGYQAFIVMD